MTPEQQASATARDLMLRSDDSKRLNADCSQDADCSHADCSQDVALICYRHGWMDDYSYALGRCPFCLAEPQAKAGIDRFIQFVNAR